MVDPSKLPSFAHTWNKLQGARKLGYEDPWGHALLRALQLDTYVDQQGDSLLAWLSQRLGVDQTNVNFLFERLQQSGLLSLQNGRWQSEPIARVPTGSSAEAAFNLKKHWLRTALARMEARAPRFLWVQLV